MSRVKVFNHYLHFPFLALAVLEFFALGTCAFISVMFEQTAANSSVVLIDPQTITYVVTFALVMLISTLAMGVYGAGLRESFGTMTARSVVSFCLLGSAAMVLLNYALPDVNSKRGALFGAVLLSLVTVLFLRWIFYSIVDATKLKRRVLVIGAEVKAKALIDSVAQEPALGFEIASVVSVNPNRFLVPEHMLADVSGGLHKLVRSRHIQEIVVAVDDRRRDSGGYYPLDELLDCKLTGTLITEPVSFYERELGKINLSEIRTGWMVFGDGFRYSQIRDFFKRGFDLLVSGVLLLITWPLMLLTALAVYLESGAPVVYSQVRVGRNGRPFRIYKFRSMSLDAEKDGKAVWARKNDSRVTRVGAFIRNTRLDELPQIYNIFKGDMSLVGPRPERPEFVETLVEEIPYYSARHRVKPGMMGWAQLKYSYGASVNDAANKLMYDLYYVKNHSLLLDFLIVVESVEVVLLGKGVR